jgi:hypothetical protein
MNLNLFVIFDADYCRPGPEKPADEIMQVCAAEFHKRNELLVEKEVLVRGVLALLHQNEIQSKFKKIMKKIAKSESTSWYAISWSFLFSFFKRQTPPNPVILTVGKHRYTRLESQVLYLAWTRTKGETFRNLSRLHRLLIAACIYAAMTQLVYSHKVFGSRAKDGAGAGIKLPWQVRFTYVRCVSTC